MSQFSRAVTEVVLIFGIPLAAAAGGFVLRRRFSPAQPDAEEARSRPLYYLGTFLMAGGTLVLLSMGAILLMMRHW